MVRKELVPQLLLISMAVSGALLAGSGFNDHVGVQRQSGTDQLLGQPEKQIDDVANNGTDRQTQTLGAIGFLKKAVGMFIASITWSLLFPAALTNVGFPVWFAAPVGTPIMFINWVGLFRLMRG